jgi:preprotein translocase subunit SecD
MKSCIARFNFILFVAAAIFSAGCQSPTEPQSSAEVKESKKSRKDKKEVSTLLFYLESRGGGTHMNGVPVYRQNPTYVQIEPAPFLDFGSLTEASVVETPGGFAIQVQFDAHGAFLLDNVTSANKGKRIAIFSKFPEPRWLAAPVIKQRNSSGMMAFTPDASREEAERLVRGLKNAIAAMKKR